MKEGPRSGMTLQISLLCYGVLQTEKKEEAEFQYTNRDALIPCIKLGVVCWVWTILSKASCGFLAVKIFLHDHGNAFHINKPNPTLRLRAFAF
jgi:hypothetical protein